MSGKAVSSKQNSSSEAKALKIKRFDSKSITFAIVCALGNFQVNLPLLRFCLLVFQKML